MQKKVQMLVMMCLMAIVLWPCETPAQWFSKPKQKTDAGAPAVAPVKTAPEPSKSPPTTMAGLVPLTEFQDSGMRITPTPPNAELYKRVDAYKQRLDGVLDQLDSIKGGIATNKISASTAQTCDALKQGAATLKNILEDRQTLETEGQAILQYTAEFQQRFVDITKEIDDQVESLRKQPLDSPQAVENLVQAYQGMKQAATRGRERAEPLRKIVLDSSRDLRSIFVEIERWPQVFDVSVKLCETFQVMGDQAEYVAMVQSLSQARQSLAQIIKKVAGMLDELSQKPLEPPPVATPSKSLTLDK